MCVGKERTVGWRPGVPGLGCISFEGKIGGEKTGMRREREKTDLLMEEGLSFTWKEREKKKRYVGHRFVAIAPPIFDQK